MTVTCLSICCYFLLRSQTCFVQEHFKRHIFLLQKWKQKCYYSCLPAAHLLLTESTDSWLRQSMWVRGFSLCAGGGKALHRIAALYSSHSPSPEITLEKPEFSVPCLPAELSTQIALLFAFPPLLFPGSCRDDCKRSFSTVTLWSPSVYLKARLTCKSLQALMKLEHTDTN